MNNERNTNLRINSLYTIYQICKKISAIDLEFSASNYKTIQLEKIYEKIILHIGSLNRLTDGDIFNNLQELDISILASIARNIMDLSTAYYYYGEPNINKNEVKLRFLGSELNYNTNVLNIFEKIDVEKNSFLYDIIKWDINDNREEIKSNPEFNNLTDNQRSCLLSGNKAYIQSIQKSNFNLLPKNIESAIFNILSNSIHSYKLGLSNNSIKDNTLNRSMIDPIMLLILSTEICIIYTSNITINYLNIRKKLNKYITKEEKQQLKEFANPNYILNYIEQKRIEFSKNPFHVDTDINPQKI